MVVMIFISFVLFAEAPDIWPILGGESYIITSPFGYRDDGFGGREGFHPAIDIAAPEGTLVLSTMTGVVVDHFLPPGWYHGVYYKGHDVYGGCILIIGEDGYATFYGHLSETCVHEGDVVTKGQVIGKVGSTGLSTGSHLHYEILVDPERFIR